MYCNLKSLLAARSGQFNDLFTMWLNALRNQQFVCECVFVDWWCLWKWLQVQNVVYAIIICTHSTYEQRMFDVSRISEWDNGDWVNAIKYVDNPQSYIWETWWAEINKKKVNVNRRLMCRSHHKVTVHLNRTIFAWQFCLYNCIATCCWLND